MCVIICITVHNLYYVNRIVHKSQSNHFCKFFFPIFYNFFFFEQLIVYFYYYYFILFLALPRFKSKDRRMLSILQEDLHLNIHSEFGSMICEVLSKNFKGIKVGFSFPNDPKIRRTYKVNGVFNSAEKFL